MFKKELIQVGDILLYKPLEDTPKNTIIGKGILTLSYGGIYAHASIYSEKRTNSIIESHYETGVIEKVLSEKWYTSIDVYRFMFDLSPIQKKHLTDYMRKYEIGKGYDLAAFPSSFLRATVAQIFGWKNFSKDRPLLNDNEHRFCSELVACSYMNALKLDICPGIYPNSVQPANLGKSKVLHKVS